MCQDVQSCVVREKEVQLEEKKGGRGRGRERGRERERERERKRKREREGQGGRELGTYGIMLHNAREYTQTLSSRSRQGTIPTGFC